MAAPLFDRVLARYWPERALERAVARAKMEALGAMNGALATMGGYSSTSGTDPFMARWSARPRSAAADTLRQLPSQRGQTRDLSRNNPLAASALATNVNRAIGTGLAFVPRPHLATLGWTPEQGREWAEDVAAEFSLWADTPECDWYGELNFYQLQGLVTYSRLDSGDCFSILPDGEPTFACPYALRVQVIEADRVGNPAGRGDTAEIAGGIRRDPKTGRITGRHVYNSHPGGLWTAGGDRYAGEWYQPVGPSGRRRMLHHPWGRTRPEQPRGVPYLAPVVSLFKLIGDYTDAEVKAAVVSAFLTLVVETPTGTGLPPIFGMGPPPAAGNAPGTQAPAADVELGPAHVVSLAKGEKASLVNPLRPNPAFRDFVQAALDQLGAGTLIGPEMLGKKFNTSYVAARAAFLDAWKHLLGLRTDTARDFCQPVAETWLAEAVLKRRVRAPGFFTDPRMRWAYTRFAWRGDSQGSINPKDEIAAYRDAVDGRLTSHERASWEIFGDDWGDTQRVLHAELQVLERDGMAAAQQAGAPAAAPQPTPAPLPREGGAA